MPHPDFTSARFEPHPPLDLPLPPGRLWVFGYGSLMWDPGFAFVESTPARLFGYHRRLCLWSIHYRGTRARPGLVLGLDRGGSCNGMAFCVAKRNTKRTVEYLLQREMLHNAYRPLIKTIYLPDGRDVQALTFVSKRAHPQFARPMSDAKTLAVIRAAKGKRGDNREYVLNTVQHLEGVGIKRGKLHSLAGKLRLTPPLIKGVGGFTPGHSI